MNPFMKRLATFSLVIAAAFGFKYFSKSSDHDDIKKTYLEEVCKDDNCRELVSERFEGCFDDNYEVGGYRRSNKFSQENFEKCIIQK
ncbi:MAG: hypothetical protein H7318_11535 [Oligoflexus sp.]|nr:hypothetical protein [Oligoflexus sp.]